MIYFNMISVEESSGNWKDGGAATLDMIVDFTRSRDLEIAPTKDFQWLFRFTQSTSFCDLLPAAGEIATRRSLLQRILFVKNLSVIR